MAFTTLPAAGEKWRASVIGAAITELRPISAVMSVDQVLNASSTAMQNLTELVVAVAANTSYLMIARLAALVAGTVVDIRYDFTFPAGTVVQDNIVGPDLTLSGTAGTGEWGANTSTSTSPVTFHPIGLTGNRTGVLYTAWIATGATAGSIQLRAAENASSATQPSVVTGSSVTLIKTG